MALTSLEMLPTTMSATERVRLDIEFAPLIKDRVPHAKAELRPLRQLAPAPVMELELEELPRIPSETQRPPTPLPPANVSEFLCRVQIAVMLFRAAWVHGALYHCMQLYSFVQRAAYVGRIPRTACRHAL